MAESETKAAKKLKMYHNDVAKNTDFAPPILKSEEGAKDDCENCKSYIAANETLRVKNSELQDKIENLQAVIKGLLVEAKKNPDHVANRLATGKSNRHLNEVTEKKLAVQKALSNSVILREVFGCLDDSSLLQLRLVCKLWADEASPRIQSRIQLFHNPEENSLGKSEVGMLPDLVDLMTNAVQAGRKSPFTRFWLTSPNLMEIPDAVLFFEKFGYLIKHLNLELTNPENSPMTYRDLTECLRNVLFKWTPNLKYFEFRVQRWPEDDQIGLLNGNDSSNCLPNLEVLNWHNSSYPLQFRERRIYLDIMRTAPNLKKILGDPPMEEVIQAKKTDAITQIRLYFATTSPDTSPNLALQSEHCFKVEEIHMRYCSIDYDKLARVFSYPKDWKFKVQFLNTVLRNNRHCLKKIECHNLGPLAENGLEIPVMPNLKTLEIITLFRPPVKTVSNELLHNFCRIFPKGLDFATTFPKLAHISWHIHVCRTDYYNNLEVFYQLPWLDTTGLLNSVRSLTFSILEEGNLELLRKIAVCLPNVKVFTYSERVRPVFSMPEDTVNFNLAILKTLSIIWELFQGLEEIHLLPRLKDRPKTGFLKYSPAQLVDSAITGLDLATVRKLAQKCSVDPEFTGQSQNLSADQEKDTKAPSIRNMKSLRYLKISVQSENDYPILTHVSDTYGFGLMSNLTVLIEATRDKGSVIYDPKGLMSGNVKFRQLPRKFKPKL